MTITSNGQKKKPKKNTQTKIQLNQNSVSNSLYCAVKLALLQQLKI